MGTTIGSGSVRWLGSGGSSTNPGDLYIHGITWIANGHINGVPKYVVGLGLEFVSYRAEKYTLDEFIEDLIARGVDNDLDDYEVISGGISHVDEIIKTYRLVGYNQETKQYDYEESGYKSYFEPAIGVNLGLELTPEEVEAGFTRLFPVGILNPRTTARFERGIFMSRVRPVY